MRAIADQGPRAALGFRMQLIVVLAAMVTLPNSGITQMPGVPSIPGGAVPSTLPGATTGLAGASTTTATGAAGGSGSSNIWSFFMKTPAQKAQMQACFCASPIGQFLNNMMMPVGLMSGGMLGPICPGPNTPNPADLNQPSSSAQGAAAKIKADEAQAKAKIAALAYLATVDCRYYPEAEAAMISGLRAEKNECVRLAAAKALASGCCCSAKVVKALMICVDCSTKDGFPAEASELVRAYAYVALDRCMRKCVQAESEIPPEPPAGAKKAMYESLAPTGSTPDYTVSILLAGYYSLNSTETNASVFAAARQTLARGLQLSPRASARLAGPRNVRDAMFPGPGRMLSATQTLPPPRTETIPEPHQLIVANAESSDSGQSNSTTASQAPDKKPNRANMLNIFQDALKR